MDQLADKLNVKAQASAKVEPYRVPLAVGGGSLVALLVVLRIRKHRSS